MRFEGASCSINKALDDLQDGANQPIDELVDAAEKEFAKKRAKKERYDSLHNNIKVFVEHAHTDNECDTCGRSFQGDEKQNFLQRQVQSSLTGKACYIQTKACCKFMHTSVRDFAQRKEGSS